MGRQYQVLIVDQNSHFRNKFAVLLREHDFAVETAFDSDEALRKLSHKDKQFDVALVELNLTPMNGLDMIREVKNAGVDTSFIIVTQAGSREDVVEALNMGVRYWLDKEDADDEALLKRVESAAQVISSEEMAKIVALIDDSSES
jgi:two-component system nitrate/nitrite response regulator NarL